MNGSESLCDALLVHLKSCPIGWRKVTWGSAPEFDALPLDAQWDKAQKQLKPTPPGLGKPEPSPRMWDLFGHWVRYVRYFTLQTPKVSCPLVQP